MTRRIVRLLDPPKTEPVRRKRRPNRDVHAILEALPVSPPTFVPKSGKWLRTYAWRYGFRIVTRDTDGGALVWLLPDELIVDGKRIPLDRRERRKGGEA